MGVEMLTRKPGTGRPSALLRSVMSFLSGVTAGLFGIDLLFLAYLERVTQNREEFRSNVCFVFLLESVFRVVLYLWNGMFTRESLLLCAVALPRRLSGDVGRRGAGQAGQRPSVPPVHQSMCSSWGASATPSTPCSS